MDVCTVRVLQVFTNFFVSNIKKNQNKTQQCYRLNSFGKLNVILNHGCVYIPMCISLKKNPKHINNKWMTSVGTN